MDQNDPATTVDPAMKRLEELEKSLPDFDPATGTTKPKSIASANKPVNRAPAADKSGSGSPNKSQTSTPSDADKTDSAEIDAAKAEAEKDGQELKLDDKGKPARGTDGKFIRQPKTDKGTVPQDQKTEDKGPGSKYAKDKARRDDSWKALNAEKESFAAQKTQHEAELKAQRDKLASEREEFQRQQQETAANYTPEAYEKMAGLEADKAAKLLAAAKEAEDAGDLEKAEQLRELAATAKGFQKLATAKAEHIRKNPPATQKQQQEAFAAQQKEWTLKAAQDFPEFAKKDGPVQMAAVDFLKMVGQQFPTIAKLPQIFYFAAQYATAKTAADRVPGLEKELGELKTKVGELEALTNPTPSGGSTDLPSGDKPFEQMSMAEQKAWLMREAAGR